MGRFALLLRFFELLEDRFVDEIRDGPARPFRQEPQGAKDCRVEAYRGLLFPPGAVHLPRQNDISPPYRQTSRTMIRVLLFIALVLDPAPGFLLAQNAPSVSSETLQKIQEELIGRHGAAQRARIERGLAQAARLWRSEDGDGDGFAAFAREHFIARPEDLEATFLRFQKTLEETDGHLNEIARELRAPTDLDTGPLLAIDRIFAGMDPWAHLAEDHFASKAAFAVLLNFPLTTLAERLEKGRDWTRRQWAEARLAQRFSKRIPAAVNQAISKASADGDAYIAEYNIWMHHVLAEDGTRLFPSGLRLISHWNLRDELKACYAEPGGIAKQGLIVKVMERIITQAIPRAVINDPRVDWLPGSNQVRAAPAETVEANAPPQAGGGTGAGAPAPKVDREPDTRYAHLLATFHAARKADPFSPAAPTLIARRFEEMREMPEERVVNLLESVLNSPLVPRVARRIEERLGRKLEPFDIWYNGFLARGKHAEADLNSRVRQRYPDPGAFHADMPRILTALGFTAERAGMLAGRIAVDPSRGAGHAMPALRRGDRPRLRTRFEKDGMNYKGFNVAIHELGHNVEQVFSLYHVDHTLLAGVPNNSFTEALAFVFQERDLELLGLEKPDAESERMRTLNAFWQTYEISGPALVDIRIWRWMYDHPDASPAELREATLAVARDLWNRRYAPVLGGADSVLLGVYSHMVSLMMYLPDYPLGHLIAFQIEEHLRGKNLGAEVERMASYGSVAPDLWMEHATGKPVSAEPLLQATERALSN